MGAWTGTARLVIIATCAAVLSIASCGHSDSSPDVSPPASASSSPGTSVTAEPEIQRSYSTDCDFGGRAERCTVRLWVNKASATVADRITLVMEAGAPTGVAVRWPDVVDLFAQTDVLSVEDERTVDPASPARFIDRRVILVEPFLPGERAVPELSIRFAGASGALCAINTDPFTISVTSLLPDAEIKEPELRGVVEPSPARRAWWIWPLAGVGVLTVIGLTAVILRRRGPAELEPLTPYGEAMRRLKELENAPPGNPAEHAAALGDTLRRYIAGVLNMEAKDRTTEELMSEIGEAPTINIASVREVLARLDEVSFAGASIGVPEANELRDRVYKLVMGIQAGYASEVGGNG